MPAIAPPPIPVAAGVPSAPLPFPPSPLVPSRGDVLERMKNTVTNLANNIDKPDPNGLAAKVAKGASSPVNTGEKREAIPSPFPGGGRSDTNYNVFFVFTIKSDGSTSGEVGVTVPGPVGGMSHDQQTGAVKVGDQNVFALNPAFYSNPRIVRVVPLDGAPDINLPTRFGDTLPTGYRDTSDRDTGRKPMYSPAFPAAVGVGASPRTPLYSPAFPAAVGIAPSKGDNLGKDPISGKPNLKDALKAAAGVGSSAGVSALAPPVVAPAKIEEKKPDKNKDKAVPPFIPPSPNKNYDDLRRDLTGLGVIIAGIASNTQFENLKNAAKTGSCESLQSPSCTKGVEDRIKDPIMGNVDATKAQTVANAGAISAIANLLATVWDFLQNKIGKVLSFLDNTIVDRAIGAANFAMNVHNALMLSNALGKTLAGVVDNATNLAGFQFTNTEGQKVTASRAFSSNVSAIIINLIGQDLFTELSDDWKVANRIYQSSTNLLNRTERLLGGQSKVAQKNGIDVANIGNALRANGIVNPNSYPPMAATKEANTPTELLSDVNSPLGSFGTAIRNLNTVTKSVSGTLKQVTSIKKEFGKLQDLTNKESKIRKSLRSQSAAQAKARAKFTFIQIKTIKATGKK